MSDDTDHDPLNQPLADGQDFGTPDVLAVLAVSSFLGAIALTTFFVTTALAHQ